MPSKYDAINKLKAKNPELTWTQAANQAGFEGEWTSYKGKAKRRTGDVGGQTRRRTAFDQPSTEMAGYEAKQLKKQSAKVSAEAAMFGLEPTQIEHLADQVDVESLITGAPGDPTNLLQVRQSEARYKDLVKLAVGKENAVTINPAEESLRVIPRKFFDPLADPATLPGVDIPIGTDIESVKVQFKGGNARLTRKALTGLAAAGLAAPAFLGTAASSAELAGRAQVAKETGDPADQFQAGLAGASLAGDVVSYFPPTAPIGEAVSTAADVANIGIDVYREDPERAKRMVKQQVQRVIPSDPIVRPAQRAVQAVQRGGKLKFGFGGVKVTLPEFGLSELLGFN